MGDGENLTRSVYVWVCEGTWRAAVDAALRLAPAGARFTLLHVTPDDVADAAHGAYAGLFGRGGRDPGARLDELDAASARDLLEAAARRLGRACERLEVHRSTERAVVRACAGADLLIGGMELALQIQSALRPALHDAPERSSHYRGPVARRLPLCRWT